MPTYDYYCQENQRTIEVMHSMNKKIYTWGELCNLVGMDKGSTPENTPVKRIISPSHIAKAPLPRFDASILPK